MKTTRSIALLLSLISTGAFAGVADSTPAQRAEIQTQVIQAKLKLSPELLAKVQAINLKYAEKMDPILKGSDNILAKKKKAGAVLDAKDAEMKAILSAEQFEQYDDAKDDVKEAMEKKLGK